MSSTSAAPDRPLTVMTYNILQGVGIDNAESLERIAAVIRDADADVVALEEVALTESGDQGDRIGELTGLAAANGRRIGRLSPGPGHPDRYYGVSVLSRYPVTGVHMHDLPVAGHDRRELLEVELSFQGGPLTVFATHPSAAEPDSRRVQLAEVRRLVAQPSTPTLLLGDFNDTPEQPTIRQFSETFVDAGGDCDAPTYPADAPTRRLDYVFVVAGFDVLHAAVLPTLA
jgi:endonuclease/exonuclease/phosphatase family metal-dependent hydrolase